MGDGAFGPDFLRGPVGAEKLRRFSFILDEEADDDARGLPGVGVSRGYAVDTGEVVAAVGGIKADSGPSASRTTRTRNGHADRNYR